MSVGVLSPAAPDFVTLYPGYTLHEKRDAQPGDDIEKWVCLVLLSQKVAVSAPVESVFMEIHISLGG